MINLIFKTLSNKHYSGLFFSTYIYILIITHAFQYGFVDEWIMLHLEPANGIYSVKAWSLTLLYVGYILGVLSSIIIRPRSHKL